MSSRTRIAAAFLLVPVLWGIGWTFMKIGLASMPPLLFLGTRQFLVGVIFLALAKLNGSRFPRGQGMSQALLLGFIMTGFSNGVMFWGVQYITSGLASILFGTMPFFVAAVSHVWLNERLTPTKIIGIGIGFAGVALLLGDQARATSEMALWGELALLLSAVTWAIPLVLIRKWLSHENTVPLTAIQMLAGSAFLLPLGLATEGLGRVHLTPDGLAAMTYMVIFAGSLGFVLYYWLASQMAASKLALNSFITPAVAVVSGIVVLGEPLEPNLVLGLALIALGIGIVNLLGEPKPDHEPARVLAGAFPYAVHSEPRYLLLKRTAQEGGEWSPVGGAAEPGETPRQAVLREAAEETGFQRFRRVVDLAFAYEFTLDGRPVRLHAFGLEMDREEPPVLDDAHEGFRWADYETARSLLPWPNQREWLQRLHKAVVGEQA